MAAAMAAASDIGWGGRFIPMVLHFRGGRPAGLAPGRAGGIGLGGGGDGQRDDPCPLSRARLMTGETAMVTADIILRGGPAALGMENCTLTTVPDARLAGP